jgi:tetratricopeptide (TPR) repeat protein
MPEDSEHPLLNLRLRGSECDPAQSNEAVDDISGLAEDVAARSEHEPIRDFVKFWRSETGLMATSISDKAQFDLIRPMRRFVTACESLCQAAEKRLGSVELSGAELTSQGMALVRLNRPGEAIPVLKRALNSVPNEERCEVLQALALAHEELDPQAAIQSLTSAIESAPQLEIACLLTYNRGVNRTRAGEQVAALADFSFVVDQCTETPMRQSALRARGLVHTLVKNYDAAIADYTQVLVEAESTPRAAVSAWMDRAALYKLQHRDAEAIEDLTRAIAAADADQLQRFRSLEARGELLEAAGQAIAAASDYEAMAQYMNASREYREELRRKAAYLRQR